MKPRNKFEKAVLAQSKKLRPITPIQINWAFRNCVEHYAHRLPKGRTTCMDCGHSWVMTEQTEHCTCPECGASLKVCLTYQRNPYKWYDLSASGVHNAPRNYGMPNLSVSGLSGVVSCFGQELLFQICFSVS
jgi:predicted RNA-binding Zn-ribbon protein involved in translation (DUF1610 family)